MRAGFSLRVSRKIMMPNLTISRRPGLLPGLLVLVLTGQRVCIARCCRWLGLALLFGAAVVLAQEPAPPGESSGTVQSAELDAELLYDILVAEVAMQRDRPLAAYPRYMAAARRTADPALAELATRAAIAASAMELAEVAVNFWVSLAPDSLQARRVAAYVALGGGKVEQALAALRAVMEYSEDVHAGYLNNARLVVRLEDPAARLQLMRTLVDEYGEDPDALLAIAGLALGADQPELARDYANRAAAQRPGWNRPRQFLVEMLVGAERIEEAVAELERFFSQGFEDLELRTLYAQLLIELERYQEALDVFAGLLELHPRMPGLLYAAGLLSLQLKDYDGARGYFLGLQADSERKQEATFLLGQVEEAAGQLEPAMDWYRQVRGDRELDAQIRMASVEMRLGDLERARERLQWLRNAYPDRQAALYLIEGEILREAEALASAMGVYDQALVQFPDHIDLLYARALLAARMGRVDLLEQDLRLVLTMDADHADALNALGYTLADQTDRLEEAERYIVRALELEPDQPAILDSKGWLLFRMGKPREAESYLRRALDQLQDGEIAAHLGEVLWALGRRQEALQVWQQAFDEDPDHDYLRRTLERHAVSLQPAGGS